MGELFWYAEAAIAQGFIMPFIDVGKDQPPARIVLCRRSSPLRISPVIGLTSGISFELPAWVHGAQPDTGNEAIWPEQGIGAAGAGPALHGSILSTVGASGKPGAVQP